MSIVWETLLIQGVIIACAMIVALIMWTVLPTSSSATFNGRHWKFGGAFAGFVFVWFSANYFVFNNDRMEKILELHLLQKQGQQKDLIKTFVVRPPDEGERYRKLFSELDKDSDFFAFNAPFYVEHETTDRFAKDALALHVKRYKENNVNSVYLFFRQQSYQNAMAFFDRLKGEIKEKAFNKHIKILAWPDYPNPPCNSFFLGTKGGKKFVALYPNPYATGGKPERVIYLEGADELYDVFRDIFLQKQTEIKQHLQSIETGTQLKGR